MAAHIVAQDPSWRTALDAPVDNAPARCYLGGRGRAHLLGREQGDDDFEFWGGLDRVRKMDERVARHESAGEWPTPAVSELLAERVRASPAAVFLVDGAERLTFAEFGRRVGAVAAGLRGLGIGAGDVVSWQLPNWWEAAVLAVAIDAVGGVSNPILPIYREREVGFVLRQARSRALFVPAVFRGFDFRELAAAVRGQVEHVVVVRGEAAAGMASFAELLAQPPVPGGAAAADPHRVSMLFYTSGTTAEPKGVLHTASTIGAFARAYAAVAGAGPTEVSLLQFPLTHIGGIGSFLVLPILLGSRVVYLDVWAPERALALIESEGVTAAGGPPALLQGLLASPGFRPERVGSVRIASTGAADIPPELVREVRRRLAPTSYRSYGLTECPMLTAGTVGDREEDCVLTDGRPTPGCVVRVVDDAGTPLPPDREGEIEGFGPQLCLGYLDSALDAAAFTADGFLRTGDLGVIDERGYVRVTGRKKDIIIRKGENLSAKAIEDVLHAHPAVAEAAVIGVPDAASGERVCACIVARPGETAPTLAAIRAFMEGRGVMRQKIPEQVEVLDALPRNSTGKVLKWELRSRYRRKTS
jgi:cyclohexanecarboxylate-CoA ligase